MVADALSWDKQESVEVVREVNICVLSSLVIRSREQLIKKQKDDVEFGS